MIKILQAPIPYIGCYTILTNKYCIYNSSQPRLKKFLKEHLPTNFPILPLNSPDASPIGCLATGNSKGLVVSGSITDNDFQSLSNLLPEEIELSRVFDKYNTLGNHVLVNDHGCLFSDYLSESTREVLEKTLFVNISKSQLGKEKLLGTFGRALNFGTFVHPEVGDERMQRIADFFGTKVKRVTVNQGDGAVGKGVIGNDFFVAVGGWSSNFEIKNIEEVLI